MKIKVITTTSDLSKCKQLSRSLLHFDYDFHFIEHPWVSFLDKIHETYKYLKSLEGYTHFLYTDAWDTFALAGVKELEKKMPDGLLISAERACYPYPELESKYPVNASPWHFVNGGGWCGEISAFLRLYEDQPPTIEMNDQVWLTYQFLKLHTEGWVKLDYECQIFQTIGFCPDSDFDLTGQLRNTVTGSSPLFIHGNGHTPMDKIYSLRLGGFRLDSTGSREEALQKCKGKKVIDIGGSTSFADGHLTAIVDFNQPMAKAEYNFIGNINQPDVWAKVHAHVKKHGKFDFAICTHTLEDISNPVYVCSQIEQIAKEGYIVVPSKFKEMGRFSGKYRGFIHHRWIFDVVKGKLTGYPKINYIEQPHFDALTGITDKDELTYFWKDKIGLQVINDDWLGPTVEDVEHYYKQLINEFR
jgi:hypothetical protein